MIHVIGNENRAKAVWGQGRDVYESYWPEILKQAGLAYETWTPESWLSKQPDGITIVTGLDGSADWSAVFQAYCGRGNSLLTIGGTHGLDDVLGVKSVRQIHEGWIGWNESALADGLQSSFHFFGSALVRPEEGTEAHGSITLHNGTDTAHPAITFKLVSGGVAALFAVDLARTFRLIQQGVPVIKDGIPSDDGSGAIDDDIFKADDSVVLDWKRDRDAVGDGVPFFLHPIVDEFRLVLLRLVHRLQEATSRTFAQVWFWPEGLETIGHISHDTDGNLVDAAGMMMERLNEADVKTSWCVIMPGYPEEVYKRIIADGHEVAFHYNALAQEGCYWDEGLFNEQLNQLQGQMAAMDNGADRIWTNKNHYLRWEGDVQFYKWCEKAGIVVEQSKGGTKQGNKGFLAGTCHPYLPASDAAENNRVMNVYSNPTLAWDPPVPLRCTLPEARALVDRCKDVYGVAHFLYHPSTFKMYEDVGPTFVELIRYGKELGLAWWTALELYNWLELRRGVEARIEGGHLLILSGSECKGLTILLSEGSLSPETAEAPGVRSVNSVERFGIRLQELILDIPQGETRIALQGAVGAAG